MVLTCIFLMAGVTRQLSLHVLVICIYSSEIYLCRAFQHFLTGLVTALSFNIFSSLCVLGSNTFGNDWFAKIFSHSDDFLTAVNCFLFFVQACCLNITLSVFAFVVLPGQCFEEFSLHRRLIVSWFQCHPYVFDPFAVQF